MRYVRGRIMMKNWMPTYGLMLVAILLIPVQADSTAIQGLKVNATMSMVDLGDGEVLINYNNATMDMYLMGGNTTVIYDEQLHIWKNGTFTLSMIGRGNLTTPLPTNVS